MNRTSLAEDACVGHGYYGMYDLAASNAQTRDRKAWRDYAVEIIASCAALTGARVAPKTSAAAESGYVFSESFESVLRAAAWSVYSLEVMSEIRAPQRAWCPVFCICADEAAGESIGVPMGTAAKVAKSKSRPAAEYVADSFGAPRGELETGLVYIQGVDLINEASGRGLAQVPQLGGQNRPEAAPGLLVL